MAKKRWNAYKLVIKIKDKKTGRIVHENEYPEPKTRQRCWYDMREIRKAWKGLPVTFKFRIVKVGSYSHAPRPKGCRYGVWGTF